MHLIAQQVISESLEFFNFLKGAVIY